MNYSMTTRSPSSRPQQPCRASRMSLHSIKALRIYQTETPKV